MAGLAGWAEDTGFAVVADFVGLADVAGLAGVAVLVFVTGLAWVLAVLTGLRTRFLVAGAAVLELADLECVVFLAATGGVV